MFPCFLVLYSPVLCPDPKRFCDMWLVAPVEEGLGDVLLVQVQPEDGVDGPGHGGTAVSHHRTVDGQVLSQSRCCHRILNGKSQQHGICLQTICMSSQYTLPICTVHNVYYTCQGSSKVFSFLLYYCARCVASVLGVVVNVTRRNTNEHCKLLLWIN